MTKNIKIEPFADTYNQGRMNNPSGLLDWKRLEKNNQKNYLINLCNKNGKSYIMLAFQNTIQSVQNCFNMMKNVITSQY